MNGILIKLRAWWDTADRTQKIITLGGGALLVFLIVGTYIVASKPKMSIVFANLAPGDAGSVQMEIESMGMPVTMDGGGNISVPSDKVALVRARLAQNNKLPKSPHPGYEGLTTMGMMNTPKVEEERLKTMLEGELAKSIEMFDGVDTASVHLTFGVDSPFATEKKDAQASVALAERGSGTVTASEGKAMATLIASSVPGMDQKKVSIFSRDGRAIYDGSSADDSSGQALSKLEMEKKEAEVRRSQLQDTLNRVVGPGNALVTVNLTIDNTTLTENSDIPVPVKSPVDEEKLQEKMTGGGVGPAGGSADSVLAPGTNDNKTTGSADNGYTRTQQHISRTMGMTHRETTKGLGDIKSMTVTVFLNKPKADAADADAQSVEKEEAVRRAVNTFMGLEKANPTAAIPPLNQPLAFAAKEGFSSEIISYPFDEKVQKDTEKAVTDQAGQQRMSQILSLVPVIVLVLLAIFVLKTIGKAAKSTGPTYALAGGGYPSLPSGPTNIFTPQHALPPVNVHEEIRQKALEAGISEEELNAAMAAAQEQGINLEDIPSIGKRINLPLEQIRKMGVERPEVVATLIKSWLLEDRR